VPVARPTIPKMLWRGIRRRCPWCGGRGAFFTGWFAKQDRCRTCGIGWQRGYEGFELGALAISAILVLGTLVAAMTVGIVLTLPGVDVLPLLVILGAGAVVLPIVLYPVSYTLWQAVDLAMRPPEAEDGAPPARR
jgi:uncharacterized protein (DUF983 family)